MSDKRIVNTESVNPANPLEVINFANQLKKIVVDNKLYSEIKGKNYVNVEGWQIAGAFMGIRPILETLADLSDGGIYRYRAEVRLEDAKTGQTVGRGIALCCNKEASKRNFDEYAIASMAQTRAVGKAYRSAIGWVLKMAGYETTPAEEIVDAKIVEIHDNSRQDSPQAPPEAPQGEDIGKKRLESAQSLEELQQAFVNLTPMDKVRLKDLKDELKIKFTEGTKS